jgi:hypothetical protein
MRIFRKIGENPRNTALAHGASVRGGTTWKECSKANSKLKNYPSHGVNSSMQN